MPISCVPHTRNRGTRPALYKTTFATPDNIRLQRACGDHPGYSRGRHDINKRAKLTQPNPSPNSIMQQNERNVSRTRSLRRKIPSGRMSRTPCKDYLEGTWTNSFCEKEAPSRMLVLQDQEWLQIWGKSAHTHIVRLMNNLVSPKRMMTKVLWLCWRRVIGKKEILSPMNVTIDQGNLGREVIRNWDKIHLNVNHLMHGNWVVYFRTWRRWSLFCGRAQTCGNQSSVWSSRRLLRVILKIRNQNLSLGYICPGEPHERSPNAPKFEDRSQEETEWARARCPRSSVEAGQKCV